MILLTILLVFVFGTAVIIVDNALSRRTLSQHREQLERLERAARDSEVLAVETWLVNREPSCDLEDRIVLDIVERLARNEHRPKGDA